MKPSIASAPLPGSFHWAQEMLATHFSLIFLDRIGQGEHAESNRLLLSQEADMCSLEQMSAMGAPPYPDGLYGRSYLVGEALIAAAGWDLLKPLAVARNAGGKPSVQAWLQSLPQPECAKALAVLPAALAQDSKHCAAGCENG